MNITQVETGKLKIYANNARMHSEQQISQLMASLSEFGFNDPVEVASDFTILSGHARVEAAKRLGLATIPVIRHEHLQGSKLRAYMLAANKIASNATWDDGLLALELGDLKLENFDLGLTGFSQEELDALLSSECVDKQGAIGDDDVPDAIQTRCKPGDIWQLGVHRLMCGDATNIADAEMLMNGDLADMIFTDPPYNVDYEGATKDKLKIKNDSMPLEMFQLFLNDVFLNYARFSSPQVSSYIFHPSSFAREFQNALELNGFIIRNQLIWAKNVFALNFGRYHFKHEPFFYAYKKQDKDVWYGDKAQHSLWEFNKPLRNDLHPTMKPVELIEKALHNSSKPNDLVIDFFGGSGSTLIACEKTNRRCNTMELDPVYCDVILTRFEEFSKIPPVCLARCLTFDQNPSI